MEMSQHEVAGAVAGISQPPPASQLDCISSRQQQAWLGAVSMIPHAYSTCACNSSPSNNAAGAAMRRSSRVRMTEISMIGVYGCGCGRARPTVYFFDSASHDWRNNGLWRRFEARSDVCADSRLRIRTAAERVFVPCQAACRRPDVSYRTRAMTLLNAKGDKAPCMMVASPWRSIKTMVGTTGTRSRFISSVLRRSLRSVSAEGICSSIAPA